MLCFALQICNIKIDFTSVISPFFSVIKNRHGDKKRRNLSLAFIFQEKF